MTSPFFRFEPNVFDVEIHTMMTGNVELKAPADVVKSPLAVMFETGSLIRITTCYSFLFSCWLPTFPRYPHKRLLFENSYHHCMTLIWFCRIMGVLSILDKSSIQKPLSICQYFCLLIFLQCLTLWILSKYSFLFLHWISESRELKMGLRIEIILVLRRVYSYHNWAIDINKNDHQWPSFGKQYCVNLSSTIYLSWILNFQIM